MFFSYFFQDIKLRGGIALLAAMLFVVAPAPAGAHVTDSSMPDGVAEVEYLILLDFNADNIEIRNKLAMVYFRQKKFAKAEKHLKKVLAVAPEDFNGLEGMGRVMAAGGHFPEAVSWFRRAIAVKPADCLVYFYLGRAHEESGDMEAAAAAFARARDNLAGTAHPLTDQEKRELTSALARTAAAAKNKSDKEE